MLALKYLPSKLLPTCNPVITRIFLKKKKSLNNLCTNDLLESNTD